LITFADRMGVARMCVFMGSQWSYEPSPEEFRLDNDEVLRAVAHRPDRLFGFVCLNPQHVQASLDELSRGVRDGPMVGVKLWVAKHRNAAELDSIISRAAEGITTVSRHYAA
jgi:predicted TIM-barrel fold metal-dependent hydrolase